MSGTPRESALFCMVEKLATGPSKLKTRLCVPTVDPTVTCTEPASNSRAATLKHMSVVAEDHDAVLHKAPLILAVGEKSRVPKLSPVTVMELLPV